MTRPVIGLTTYAEPARYGPGELPSAMLPMAYVRAVHEAGGTAVLVPPGSDVLEVLDGVIFTGGADLGPDLYGAAPHETTVARPDRDAAELGLLRAALAADRPVLGICRGAQLLAVAAGGRLHQHLPDVLGHSRHRAVVGGPMGQHPVRLEPGSRCHAILGETLLVNSYHHQGVADPGTLVAVGWCPDDGLIEAVEDPAREFVLGVQWHAEELPDRRLFQALIKAATAR